MNIHHPKASPVMIVGLTALFFFSAFAIASYLRFRAKGVDPRVTMESKERVLGKQAPAQQTAIPTLIDGEVARTADRIGEATSLALSACLFAAGEQTRGRTPHTVRDLLNGVATRNLIPPGLTLIQTEGVLASRHGTLSVRYRPLPLGIEVISIGNKPEYGPALIARVPDELSDKGEATLFIANSLAGVKVPSPFAPSAEVIALGWSPEKWRSLR
jgi:hypothetical protein